MSRKLMRLYNRIMFTSGAVMLLLGPILDLVMREYNLDKGAAGLLSMTYMAGNIPGMLLSGRFINFQRLRFATFWFAISLMIVAAAPSSWLFALAFFASGLAAGFLFSGTASMVAVTVPPEEKGAKLGKLYGWLAIGVVLGPIYSSLWQHYGFWREIPLSYGFVFLLIAIFFPQGEDPPVPQRGERVVPKSVRFWLICAALFFYVGAESVVSIWVVKFLLDQFQLAWSNFVLVGLWLNITLGRFILARIGHRYSNTSLLVVLSLWSTFTIFLAAFAGPTLSVISFLLVGFGFSGIYSLLIDEGSAIGGEASIGLLGTFGVLGASIFSAVAGFIAESVNFSWGIALGAFLSIGIFLSVFFSRKAV